MIPIQSQTLGEKYLRLPSSEANGKNHETALQITPAADGLGGLHSTDGWRPNQLTDQPTEPHVSCHHGPAIPLLASYDSPLLQDPGQGAFAFAYCARILGL